MLKQACFQINWDSQNALVKEGQEGGGGQGRGQPVLQLGEDLCAPGSQVSTSITDQGVGQIVMVKGLKSGTNGGDTIAFTMPVSNVCPFEGFSTRPQ